MFMSFPVIVPPLSDQIGIADFLDGEIAKIDRLTPKQNELVSALHEYLRATTMRLTMEPGRGWHRTRVGLALKKLTRLPSETDPVVTALRDGQMTSRENRREDGYTEAYSRWVELMSVRRVDVNGGPFVKRIGLPYSLLTRTGGLICIIPLGFLGSTSPTCAR